MSRLTVNAAGTSGYTDEIILTPGDFTTAAGNTTTLVNIPVKEGDVIDGVCLDITEAFSISSNITIGAEAAIIPGSVDPDGFIEAVNANAVAVKTNTGDLVDDGGEASNTRVVVVADGNITVTSASALDVSTSGKMRLLLSIKRVNF